MADYYETMTAMKKKAREDDMAAKSGEPAFKGPSPMEMLGRSAVSAAAGAVQKAKAVEKGAEIREKLKPGSMQSKTGMGPAKK